MKRTLLMILFFLAFCAFGAGCQKQQPQQTEKSNTTAIANPWSDWDSLKDAEAAVGFSYGLPEEIPEGFSADTFRSMNGELLEVIYRNADSQIRIRKTKGENQDISGDYNTYDLCTQEKLGNGSITSYRNSGDNTAKLIICCNGFSWSLVAEKGLPENSNQQIIDWIFEE